LRYVYTKAIAYEQEGVRGEDVIVGHCKVIL